MSNAEQILADLKDTIQTDLNLALDTTLESIPEWDSLAMISTLSMFNQDLGVALTMEQLRNAQTVGELINMAGDQLPENGQTKH